MARNKKAKGFGAGHWDVHLWLGEEGDKGWGDNSSHKWSQTIIQDKEWTGLMNSWAEACASITPTSLLFHTTLRG